jgi:iron complex transport system ATP-binding protein
VSVERAIQEDTGLGVIYSGRDAMFGSWGERDGDAETRARELLQRVECEALERRSFRVMSPGERQRLLIGRALMAEPELLILDEPCAGLDPAARERFLAFLEVLTTSPSAPSCVLVTHHVEEITSTFTHVLLLRDGRVVAQGLRALVMNSAALSQTFGEVVRVEERAGRYQLVFESPVGWVRP